MGPNDTTMAGLQCWVSAAERPGEAVGINKPLGPEWQTLGPEWQAAFAEEADASARLALTPEEGEWPKRDAVPFVETIREGRYTIAGTVEGDWPVRDRVPVVRDAAYWRSVTNGVFAFDPALGPDHMPARGFAEQTIGLRPAEVTEEMIEAAYAIVPGGRSQFEAIYRAMHAIAPVPLVSDAEIALTRERDQWRGFSEAQDKLLSLTTRERDEARAERKFWHAAFDDIEPIVYELAALRAELMAAHDRLAKFTVQNAAETEAPDPIANALNVSRKAPKWP